MFLPSCTLCVTGIAQKFKKTSIPERVGMSAIYSEIESSCISFINFANNKNRDQALNLWALNKVTF